MLAQERYEIILDLLEKQRIVKVAQLCEIFNVSAETVRRDLERLEGEGKLKRVYGGAILNQKSALEPSYHSRVSNNAKLKEHIGKNASELISDGETLMIDLGTTTLEFAKQLKQKKNLTIITNCVHIAQELVDVPGFRIILIGGVLRAGELALSGFISEEFLNHFNVDKTIIGVGGVTTEDGVSDYHIEETRVRKLMIDKGKQVIALADYSKFGVKALVNVCSLDKIDIIVTDDHLDKEVFSKYYHCQLQIIVASTK